MLDGWGETKYKIYNTAFGRDNELAFQTNDKELFISKWKEYYSSVMSIDDIDVSFTIGKSGGGCMNEKDLIKYLDELEQKQKNKN